MSDARMIEWAAKVESLIARPPETNLMGQSKEQAIDSDDHFKNLSTWGIVCEEVLDTQYTLESFEQAKSELLRRGISIEQYQEMRRFAWLTAGWLNFEKMLYDWCSLDEKDILRAIDWQFADGWIDQVEHQRLLAFADRYIDSSNPSDAFEPDVIGPDDKIIDFET